MRVNKLEMFGDVVYKNDPLAFAAEGIYAIYPRKAG